MDFDTKKLVDKYKKKLEAEIAGDDSNSREYQLFKVQFQKKLPSKYEKLAMWVGSKVQPKVPKAKADALQESIDFAKLAITPADAIATSYVIPMGIIIIGMLISVLIFSSMFMAMFSFMFGVAFIVILGYYPHFLANNERMAASNQMVLCIFYVVTYMRHTSNLERGVTFAAAHLAPPLSEDMKKVLWDVQTNKFENVKMSLDNYLKKWAKYNKEFVESFNLIQSSLLENNEERRIGMLEKALDNILEQTYEKMLHFAQSLKGPITLLHMMGIILPILGMVMLPMMVSFVESVRWWHIALVYNMGFPMFVFIFGKKILASRPSGYGAADQGNETAREKLTFKLGPKEFSINPIPLCVVIGVFVGLVALIPVAADAFIQCEAVDKTVVCTDINLPAGLKFFGYRASASDDTMIIGPFGLGASLLSGAVPLAFALSIGLFYYIRSKKVLQLRERTKKLESEFTTALFQFGNRLGDGIPAEIAFEKAAEQMRGTQSGQFFQLVNVNIRQLGMGVDQALFDPKRGAVLSYPSSFVQSSMKILSESIKKGPAIAANAILNISRYIKEIKKVNERLKDLMAEIIADMKNQISFLTPAIASIVIAITAMISSILGELSNKLKNIDLDDGTGGGGMGGNVGGILSLFGDGIPTYYFQIVIGTYVFQIVYLLTIISNSIENGNDVLQEEYLLGNNLIRSTILYVVASSVLIVLFSVIAGTIVNRIK
ncbi:hypothetical protein CMO91_00710 [Candidatus Woesearchaeota archaeon]|nr:hypothetical protein [Candidatus Woesearchaeota archaeon]